MVYPLHEHLALWHKAAALAEHVYRKTNRFPPEEKAGMTATLRRLAVGIAATIAQGYDRQQQDHFHKALCTAQSSLCEMQSHLYLAVRLGMASRWRLGSLRRRISRLHRQIQDAMDSIEAQQEEEKSDMQLRRAA